MNSLTVDYNGTKVFFVDYTAAPTNVTLSHRDGRFYEERMLSYILRETEAGLTYVDCGANLGNHTIFFAKICKAKHVFSFEPSTPLFNILNENARLNGVEEIVKAYNVALGATDSRARGIDENSGNPAYAEDPDGDTELVRLDSITFPTKVDIIKVDVEHFEFDLLVGARELLKKDRPVIFVELLTEAEHEKTMEYLLGLGYREISVFNASPTYLYSTGDRCRGINKF